MLRIGIYVVQKLIYYSQFCGGISLINKLGVK